MDVLANLTVQRITKTHFNNNWRPGELLIALLPYGAVWNSELLRIKTNAQETMTRSVHHLTAFYGFDDGRPFVLVEWKAPGQNALERRWILQEWSKTLPTTFNLRSWCILLAGEPEAEQRVWAEDLITSNMTPLYDLSKLQSVKLLTFNDTKLQASDPHGDARFSHQLEFRRWVNEDPDSLTSIEIGRRLQQFAEDHGCEFQTFDESALRDLNMNLLLAVGQASKRSPARLHIVTHNGSRLDG